MIWVTADLHLNHQGILKTCRKFNSIEEHNEYIIQQYNSVVGKDDLVYILGDCLWAPLTKGADLIRRLNGSAISNNEEVCGLYMSNTELIIPLNSYEDFNEVAAVNIYIDMFQPK